MGLKSQVKGKRFEAEIAEAIGQVLGERAVRNLDQQGDDAGRDLLTRLPFCIQCEHVKGKPHVYEKLKEAKGSAREGEIGVAILRQDRKPIVAVMSLADWLELVRKAYA